MHYTRTIGGVIFYGQRGDLGRRKDVFTYGHYRRGGYFFPTGFIFRFPFSEYGGKEKEEEKKAEEEKDSDEEEEKEKEKEKDDGSDMSEKTFAKFLSLINSVATVKRGTEEKEKKE